MLWWQWIGVGAVSSLLSSHMHKLAVRISLHSNLVFRFCSLQWCFGQRLLGEAQVLLGVLDYKAERS